MITTGPVGEKLLKRDATVALDLLNLPRDLSTNLNEDSDNQKENVVPSKRFRMVTDEENGGVFIRGKFK
jgi:hypothetical protein